MCTDESRSSDDVLVHWCHGAPAICMLLARASKVRSWLFLLGDNNPPQLYFLNVKLVPFKDWLWLLLNRSWPRWTRRRASYRRRTCARRWTPARRCWSAACSRKVRRSAARGARAQRNRSLPAHCFAVPVCTVGLGICHGISGNGEVFLNLFRQTKATRSDFPAYSR